MKPSVHHGQEQGANVVMQVRVKQIDRRSSFLCSTATILIGQSGYETLNKYLIFKDDTICNGRGPQPASRIIVKNQYSDRGVT